jgi:hypothetical protein
MPDYEVPEPILNSPYDEPAEHWNIEEGACRKGDLAADQPDISIATQKRPRAMTNMPREERGRNSYSSI